MADSAPGPGLTGAERRALLPAAWNEITEHRIYRSVAARSTDADNRRVRNARLKSALGLTLRYPTYREGLKAILASEN